MTESQEDGGLLLGAALPTTLFVGEKWLHRPDTVFEFIDCIAFTLLALWGVLAYTSMVRRLQAHRKALKDNRIPPID